MVGTKGAVIVGNDGRVRRKIGSGDEEIMEAESAMDIDPSGNLGRKDNSGAIRSTVQRNETIQEHFFRCIEEDLEPICSGADGRKTLATIKALQLSAQRETSVNLVDIG